MFLTGLMAQPQQEPEELSSLENLIRFDVNDASVSEISFRNPVTFTDPSLIMGQIAGVAIDEGGRVFIADRDNSVIYLFNPDGSHVSTVGGEGDGPGEFRSLRNIQAGNGFLHVLDLSQRRITRFDPRSLEVAGTTSLSGDEQESGGFNLSRFPNHFSLLPNGNYLITFSAFTFPGMGNGDDNGEPMLTFDILTPEGSYLGLEGIQLRSNETITSSSGGSFRIVMPAYGRKGLVTVNNDGQVYTNWSENLLIKMYDSDGNYIQAFYSDYKKPALDRDEMLASAKETSDEASFALLKEQKFPETWPAVRQILADDNGHLWISLYTEDPGFLKWLILDENGRPQGTIEMPDNRRLQAVYHDHAYTIEPDDDGFDTVRRYEVKL